ncbi:hypothetical protein [Streptomyces sp. NPDC047046]|uniref:hypothetical protein n=1 Tax=Streptomyces sp. NPDC047046 TaxID=3155378 RepID=UPI0033F29059
MEGAAESLAHLAGACAQISLAATLCDLAIHHRTEIYLYDDADPTPVTSADQLRRAADEMGRAAATYRALAQGLSRRLASSTTRIGEMVRSSHTASAQTPPNTPPHSRHHR